MAIMNRSPRQVRSTFLRDCGQLRAVFVTVVAAACLLSIGDESIALAEKDKTSGRNFKRDIKPIFNRKCGKCHREQTRKGGLDLLSLAGIRHGGESEEPLITDSLDDSYLWAMITEGEMPPEDQPALTDKEKHIIREWLERNARNEMKQLSQAKQPINQHDILPIVLLRCVTCHGPQRKNGGLDLRTPDLMRKGGKSGPALIAGKPDESLMIQRIESEACPPRELLLKFFIRRPPTSEVAKLREWITAGAPVADIAPDVASTIPDPLVSDDDRQHWAFQPLKKFSAASSIDAFIGRKLHKNSLQFSEQANRDTLIRRAYLDLTGLPPTADEWTSWKDSSSAAWYDEMINYLLGSPRYGERWGRYWLDVAGYADSEGGVSSDPVRKVAWKYRDYVIRSFNEDKPYDRFLIEQLAGDELIDHQQAELVTSEMVDNLIATGFLRMGIDQTGSRTMNFVPERLGVIGDAITIVGEGLMGLTLGCARCHSHKYDAIPHRDYYRFKAIFQGAFDEHDWLTFKNRNLSVDVPERVQRVAKINPPLRSKLKKLQSKLRTAETEVRITLLKQHYPDQSENDRSETLRALRIADNNRTLPQRILVEKLRTVEVIADEDQPEAVVLARYAVRSIQEEIKQCNRQMEPPLTIRAVWDRGQPSPTYILRRGEHTKSGSLVGPGVPSVLTNGKTPFIPTPPFPNGTVKTGRRLAFARWLTTDNQALTARVMVNRIWYHHFGVGLVKSLENFGVKGEQPSHPELLDWLASEFVSGDWSIKNLHRLIMNSRTYRQSSEITDDRQRIDPQNHLLSRMTMKRMDAEALRDSLLFVSGKLDMTTGGVPDAVNVDLNGLVSVDRTPSGGWRRSVYLQYRRTEIPSMMATFDYPEMGPNCLSRSVSTVSPQSLMLMNSKHVRELASAFASRVAKFGTNVNGRRKQIEAIYVLALSRLPTKQEIRLGAESLANLERTWKQPEMALETYCHTILNSAAFIYVD